MKKLLSALGAVLIASVITPNAFAGGLSTLPPGGGGEEVTVNCSAPIYPSWDPYSPWYGYNVHGTDFASHTTYTIKAYVYRNGTYTGTSDELTASLGKYGVWSTSTEYGPLGSGEVSIHAKVYRGGVLIAEGSGACVTRAIANYAKTATL